MYLYVYDIPTKKETKKQGAWFQKKNENSYRQKSS
nr:hypothetical protein [Clostridium cellulovorans]